MAVVERLVAVVEVLVTPFEVGVVRCHLLVVGFQGFVVGFQGFVIVCQRVVVVCQGLVIGFQALLPRFQVLVPRFEVVVVGPERREVRLRLVEDLAEVVDPTPGRRERGREVVDAVAFGGAVRERGHPRFEVPQVVRQVLRGRRDRRDVGVDVVESVGQVGGRRRQRVDGRRQVGEVVPRRVEVGGLRRGVVDRREVRFQRLDVVRQGRDALLLELRHCLLDLLDGRLASAQPVEQFRDGAVRRRGAAGCRVVRFGDRELAGPFTLVAAE